MHERCPGLTMPVHAPSNRDQSGGGTERGFRRAALLGDGWLPIWHKPSGRGFTPEALRVKVDELARVAREAGRRRPHDVAGLMPLASVAMLFLLVGQVQRITFPVALAADRRA